MNLINLNYNVSHHVIPFRLHGGNRNSLTKGDGWEDGKIIDWCSCSNGSHCIHRPLNCRALYRDNTVAVLPLTDKDWLRI